MKRSEAAKYARWSAAAALLCAAVTVGVYLKRGWTRYNESKNAPPAPAVNVERQSTGLTFSKGEGTHTIFRVEASKSTDFKGRNATDLEGVKVTVFGKEGTRHDSLETHSCRYTKDSGNFDCAGDVQITLMSKEEWEAAADHSRVATMRVETRGMTFNRASGQATTDQEVRFTFSGGGGQAVGAEYRSEEGTLQLLRDVQLKLDQPAPAKTKGAKPQKAREPVEITGSRMEIKREAGTMYLAGPAEAKTRSERLTAAGLLLELDAAFHAERLTAQGNGKGSPEFTAQKGTGQQRLSAQEIVAEFAPQGWITRAEARGQVRGEATKGEETQTVVAQNVAMEMVPRQNSPKLTVLKGGVDARTAERRLTTEELRLTFAEKGGANGTKLQNAETVGPGRLEWKDAASASTKAAQTILQARQLAMQFDASGGAARLDAVGDVQTERTVVGGVKQTATANRGFVDMLPRGGWSRMQLNENVQLSEPRRSAVAEQATFTRAEQSVILTGHATVKDASTQTSAQKLTFWQTTGDVRGEGNVRSSDLSANSAVHLAPVASNISADNLTGNSKSGRALYTGHARLWQGDSVLEAESIELLKNERVLNATGNVRAVFPQVARSASSAQNAPSPSGAAGKTSVLWHAQSANLTYWDTENRARLEKNVVVQSPEQRMNSDVLDLYFSRGGSASSGVSTGSASATLGAQQISRAIGTGSVVVQQGSRRAAAERGEYTASDGKFVMTGGTPTLFDASEGTTTGRQLTFFLADATIIVDSENGSRTLTKHRVENK